MLLENSVTTPEAMFRNAQSSNNILTWLLRAAGFVMMFGGIALILHPLSVLADLIPFIGGLIGIGNTLVAFFIALPCTLITIVSAWLFYRPVLGGILVAIAVAAVVFLLKKRNDVKKRKTIPTT